MSTPCVAEVENSPDTNHMQIWTHPDELRLRRLSEA